MSGPMLANSFLDGGRTATGDMKRKNKLRNSMSTEDMLVFRRTEAIDNRRFADLDVKVDRGLRAKNILTKHAADINDALTTDLHQPTREFRRTSILDTVLLEDLNNVVRDELIPSSNQVECTLRLARTGLTDNKHTRLPDAHKYAMNLKRRGLRFRRIGCQINALHSWLRFYQTVVTILACVNY